MTDISVAAVASMIERLQPLDELGARHQAEARTWLAATSDIYRRIKPRTPSPHLVSYFLLVDRDADRVLLCDHRLSGLWLPTGGHVEPGEHPGDTVRREIVEELGVAAQFDRVTGEHPFFLTITQTVGEPAARHTDVTLWYALAGTVGQRLVPDEREFAGVRWWSRAELDGLDVARREPHLLRALDALPEARGSILWL